LVCTLELDGGILQEHRRGRLLSWSINLNIAPNPKNVSNRFPINEKSPVKTGLLVAGAGLEPTTFGL
jgi:hypothetical protein